jgi:hypothetical protein
MCTDWGDKHNAIASLSGHQGNASCHCKLSEAINQFVLSSLSEVKGIA